MQRHAEKEAAKEKIQSKDETKEPESTPSLSDETNRMLLGVMNPSIITGNPIIITSVPANSTGIVEQGRAALNKGSALYRDDETDADNENQMEDDANKETEEPSNPSPFRINPFSTKHERH
jgi:hypothetical protein